MAYRSLISALAASVLAVGASAQDNPRPEALAALGPPPISFGYPGTTHRRNSQTINTSAHYGKLFWAGSCKSLESPARSAARGGVAGHREDDILEARLAFVPEYRRRFGDVFGDDWPSVRHACMSIAAFVQTARG